MMYEILRYRQRRPLVWILGWIVLAFAIFTILPTERQGTADIILTLALTLAFIRAVWLMIRHTRIWTWRGQGLLGTVAGDAFLYFSLGAGAYLGFREHTLDLARAFLAIGVIHLLIGLEPHVAELEVEVEDVDGDPQIRENTEPKRPLEGASYDDL